MKGAKKQYALKSNQKLTRQPITLTVLKHTLRELREPTCHLCKHDKRMLAAAFMLAFFGLLRVSEFTVPSRKTFDPRKHASIVSIKWRKKHFNFTIKSSKTDQLGQNLYIPRASRRICPFSAMRQYFNYCGLNRLPKNAPLFKFKTGRPLTRHSCLTHLRTILAAAGYQSLAFNTNSFCIGADTSGAKAGLPISQIKLLGRWCSSAYQSYTCTDRNDRKTAASSLAKLNCVKLNLPCRIPLPS